MSHQLTPEEQKALGAILGIGMLILAIIVAIIHIAQALFWISVVAFFASFLYIVISLIIDIPRIVDGEDYFDEFPHTLLAIALIFIFWTSAHISFPIGYSPTSQKILEFAGQVEEVQSLPMQIQRQALHDVCLTTQVNPACKMVDTIINLQAAGRALSDTAEIFTWVFRLKVNFPS